MCGGTEDKILNANSKRDYSGRLQANG